MIRPRSRPWSSTSGNFSILYFASSLRASSLLIPGGPVTSGIGVITSPTGRFGSSSKRMSRLVTMPSSFRSESTTGTPEMRKWPHISSTWPMVASRVVVIGWSIMPASERFTRSTWLAWSVADMLRCRMPMPPSRAMAIAMRDSVTVSIAELNRGIRSRIRRLTEVVVSTADGITSLSLG